jgi:pimeloyl-ACP methyl ester carboxylesterase
MAGASIEPPPWARELGLRSLAVTGADGARLRVLTGGGPSPAGSPGPRVIMLHGFPQHAGAWRRVAPLLVAEARLVIPDLRGYGGSDLARGDRYDLETLASDVVAIDDATRSDDGDRPILVAHDWGGPVAWHAVHRHPTLARALVATNAPHFGAYARQLGTSRDQRKRSWYTAVFQIPGVERLLSARGGAGFRLVFRTSSPPGLFSPEEIDDYVRPLLEPGRARAALSYYRAGARVLAQDRRAILDLPPVAIPVIIPWGQADAALSREHPEACRRYATDLAIRRLDGVSHWVPEQAPEAIAQAVRDLDARTRPA